jgi:hypothetical protein
MAEQLRNSLSSEFVPALAPVQAEAIPQLVSAVYLDAPAPLRTQLLECLLRPVGPLAIVTIAAGAFAHLLYRMRLHGMPLSHDDAARIQPEHVVELARYVAQASPETLLRMGSLVADNPLGVATVTGTALIAALGAWRRRPREAGPA